MIAQSMGDAWLVCGLVCRIVMLLRRNVHVDVLVPKSGPFPPLCYYHSNRYKFTGVLEELVAYYCGNLYFQMAANEHYYGWSM